MQEVIKLINNHRSLREFSEEKLSQEEIENLVGQLKVQVHQATYKRTQLLE